MSYGNRDADLGTLEKVYNFGQRSIAPLKREAERIMRSRNPATKKDDRQQGLGNEGREVTEDELRQSLIRTALACENDLVRELLLRLAQSA